MELTVFWTEFAKHKLNDIFEYYKRKSRNVNVARKLVDGIIDHTIGLEKQPYIGQREELLTDRPQKFRYLVFKDYQSACTKIETSKQIKIQVDQPR